MYEDGKDCIGPHNDKVDDIEGPIYTFSFGAQRELHLHDNDNDDLANPDDVIIMEPGSLLILGPETNKVMKHSIPEAKFHRVLPKDVYMGSRTSIIFRTSHNILTQDEVDKKVAIAERAKEARNRA